MKSTRYYLKPGQVDQIKDEKTQVEITWNPDDNKYYVESGEEKQPHYKHWKNAVQKWKKIVASKKQEAENHPKMVQK